MEPSEQLQSLIAEADGPTETEQSKHEQTMEHCAREMKRLDKTRFDEELKRLSQRKADGEITVGQELARKIMFRVKFPNQTKPDE